MLRFVTDSVTHTIDRQLLWGPALLITPVVDQVGCRLVRINNIIIIATVFLGHCPIHD